MSAVRRALVLGVAYLLFPASSLQARSNSIDNRNSLPATLDPALERQRLDVVHGGHSVEKLSGGATLPGGDARRRLSGSRVSSAPTVPAPGLPPLPSRSLPTLPASGGPGVQSSGR